MSVPENVTIIVHGARGLQGRKSGRHKFSVIFGVGHKKYRTEVVKDPTGCPDFNEEIIVPTVNVDDNVFFTITEKEDILGQLSIPVSSLQSTKGRILRAVLLPHRKCPRPQGELIYQCYVSKHRTHANISQHDSFSSQNDSKGSSGFSKFKHSLATTPILPRKLRKNKRSDTSSISGSEKDHKHKGLSGLNKKFSRSLHDLINFARGISEVEDVDKNKTLQRNAPSTNFMDEIGHRPSISAITPSEGSPNGGTQLVIIGRHLGIETTDIVCFKLCGCDLRDTLQYESTMRLFCTTKPWPEQTGTLEIETTSGGRTIIENAFTFTSTINRKVSVSSMHPTFNRSASNTSAMSNSTAGNRTPTAIVNPAVKVTPSSPGGNRNNSAAVSKAKSMQNLSADESCDSEQTNVNSNLIIETSTSKNKYHKKKDNTNITPCTAQFRNSDRSSTP